MGRFRLHSIQRLTVSRFLRALAFAAPVQTFYLIDRGMSMADLMLLESVLSVAIMFFEVPTGIVGDRVGRKWSLVLGALIGLAAWVPFLLATSFAMFALSFFMNGISFTFASGSDQALIYDHLKAKGRERSMSKVFGRYSAAAAAATIVSGLCGGALAVDHSAGTFHLLFGLSIAAHVVGLLFLLTVREAPGTDVRRGEHHGPLAGLKEGVALLRGNSKLRRIALLSVFSGPMATVLAYAYQPYFEVSQVPSAWFGVAVAAGSGLGLVTTLAAHRLEGWLGVERALLVLTLGPAVLWFAMALLVSPWCALALYVLHTASCQMRGPVFSNYTNLHIPSHIRATVLSTISVAAAVYMLTVRPLLGAIVDVDMALGFAACAAVVAAGSLLFRVRAQHVQVTGAFPAVRQVTGEFPAVAACSRR
jgi:MFS family permease